MQMRIGYPAASDEDIRQLEDKLQVTLPSDYRHFLNTINGGLPEDYLFVSPGEEIAVRFFGVSLDTEFDYDDVLANAALHEDVVAAGMLPIGADPGGNLILLGVDPRNTGNIFYRDKRAYEESYSERMVSLSFSEFVAGLRRDPGEL